ncbi:protein SPIRAL1-like 3 [Henckelia pumila]|uniref:protein SPIRAL1-like 3 n=1 Tax=Henckelia pumila TaxID=405737 RepID=UPI003C6DEE6A
MGRGVSSGGGQSSLGYLFGDGGAPAPKSSTNSTVEASPQNASTVVSHVQEKVLAAAPPPAAAAKQIPAVVPGSRMNNYHRADGQNCGNFLTDRPSTKVHAAPGGGSSLGYLFGGGSN